jgi:hypothetical protein
MVIIVTKFSSLIKNYLLRHHRCVLEFLQKSFMPPLFSKLNMGFLQYFPLLLTVLFAASLLLVAAQPVSARPNTASS